jgi:hypothetical protein
MTSYFSSTPHSCIFCRKLVLYKRDSKWWKAALASKSEDTEIIGPVLSARIKEWLIKEFRGGPDESKNFNLLHSLGNISIFDCTMAEARDAAAEGCSLCALIVYNPLPRTVVDDTTFLAARNSLHYPSLGVIRTIGMKSKFKESKGDKTDEKSHFMVQYLNGGPFEIVALQSKYGRYLRGVWYPPLDILIES